MMNLMKEMKIIPMYNFMQCLLKRVKSKFKKLYLKYSPIQKNKIVFDNFGGRGFGCNPKYIALELLKRKKKYDLVWITNNLENDIPKGIRKVKFGTFRSYLEYATAKIWVSNVRFYKGVEKKKGQFYIQTWHAGYGIKKCEAQIEEMLGSDYLIEAKNDGKIVNLMIASNGFMENLMKNHFWYSGRILKVGSPRNDIIVNHDKTAIEKVYEYFKLQRDVNIVLYAPTFRVEDSAENYRMDYEKVCTCLEEKFEKKYVMLIKLHPNSINLCNDIKYTEKIMNASNYDDMQELLVAADVVITDYSSCIFDFYLSRKPIFTFAKDIKEYITKERTLNCNIQDLPFPIAYTEEELYEEIQKFDMKKYLDKCDTFYEEKELKESGNASIKVVDEIEKVINSKGE